MRRNTRANKAPTFNVRDVKCGERPANMDRTATSSLGSKLLTGKKLKLDEGC